MKMNVKSAKIDFAINLQAHVVEFARLTFIAMKHIFVKFVINHAVHVLVLMQINAKPVKKVYTNKIIQSLPSAYHNV